MYDSVFVTFGMRSVIVNDLDPGGSVGVALARTRPWGSEGRVRYRAVYVYIRLW